MYRAYVAYRDYTGFTLECKHSDLILGGLLLTAHVGDLCYDVEDKMADSAQLVIAIDSAAIDFWFILPTGLELQRSGILIIDNRFVFRSCRWRCETYSAQQVAIMFDLQSTFLRWPCVGCSRVTAFVFYDIT